MTSIKYRNSVGCFSVQKSSIAYIESGGTHYLFHSRSVFETYEKIDIIDVRVASRISKIIGKGLVTPHFESEVKVEAYHAPQFESSIILVRILSSIFDVAISGNRKVYHACFSEYLTIEKAVAECSLVNNMHPIIMGSEGGTNKKTFKFAKKDHLDK